MKRNGKKKIIISIILLAMILLAPIPTGQYKDGGTREYTALTYKVIKWNKLVSYEVDGMDGQYSKLRIYPFPMNFLSYEELWEREKQEQHEAENCEFGVQYIRTNGYHDDVKYPIVKMIRSVDELNVYYEENKEIYDLERKDRVYSDTTIGFLDACDKYDDDYFKNQVLIFVLLEEGSGSTRHKVSSVQVTKGGQLAIYIETQTPEVGTCDMAEWHIFVEPEAEVAVADESDVIVFLDGQKKTTMKVMQ